ncbi:MAG: tetratricopeptide repeat protein [Pseudomonadota bacterium]
MKMTGIRVARVAAAFGFAFAGMAAQADVAAGLEALDAQDFEAAITAFDAAAADGDGEGFFYLGRLIELGVTGQPDLGQAIALYQEAVAAEPPSPQAQNRLGLLYLEGAGVIQDYEEGARLVCAAAEAGDENALFNCALVLIDGQGVEPDAERAIEYAMQASELGNIGAKNLLAQSYITGEGVEPDDVKAVQFFQQTAAAGNPVGLFSLGQAYAMGIGLDRDLIKAHAFFNLAAARNHPEALQARQVVEAQLERDQVTEAQRFARAWRPTPVEGEETPEN